jgi:hypothetical protein
VCSLVSPAAVQAANVPAPCVQARVLSFRGPVSPVYVATWGSSKSGADHFMSVQVAPARAIRVTRTALFPRGPGKPLGPWQVTPTVKAYWTQSSYSGTPGGRGTMRFVKGGHLIQITLLDSQANVLPGLKAVASSIAARL